MTEVKKDVPKAETPEQKELRELRESNQKLKADLAEKENDLNELLGDGTPIPDSTSKVFPGNIIVCKLIRDEFKNPTHYEEMEVPEDVANEQLSLPKGQRSKPYQDICYKKDVEQRFMK
jgi:hypothetical protein